MSERPAPRRDEGAVLPLVLVLMVIGALIVVPLLGYSVSVLRANTVVAENTRDREAAEGGVRLALTDPTGLFRTCTGGTRSVALPAGVVDGINVSVTCRLADELGPLDVAADGSGQVLDTPTGVTATQIAATLPSGLAGTTSVSPATLPATDKEKWWAWTSGLTEATTWLPNLPPRPSLQLTRTTTPYAMPATFGCTVFLPGYYSQALTVSAGRVYFASGLYYFEQPVTFTGNADVIVGMGTHAWDDPKKSPTDCADDNQVRANLLTRPASLGIQGGGATFVFGANGRLVIDNTSTTTPTTTGLSVRFNQRYAEAYDGGRVSIMSVNGDDSAATEHLVTDVVAVPRSLVVGSTGAVKQLGESGAEYLPSNSTYTSEARAPIFPATSAVTFTKLTTPPVAPSTTVGGAAFVTWDEITGTNAGGAPITGYTVEYTSAHTTPATRVPNVCPAESIVSPAPGKLGCYVQGLRLNRDIQFFVTATNRANLTSTAISTTKFRVATTDPLVAVPATPAGVTVTTYQDAAGLAWTAPAHNGSPILSYTVTAERVYRAEIVPASGPDENGVVTPAQYEDRAQPVGLCAPAVMGRLNATTWTCTGLAPLVDTPTEINAGYRFTVVATNAVGSSAPASFPTTSLAFAGAEAPAQTAPAAPAVVPWVPMPIVDVKVSKDVASVVSIPGYVSVPMGRVSIDNPRGKDVRMSGGILTSTMVLNDPRPSSPDPLPIGYKNDIVLQRTLAITAKAGNTTVTTYVQINENGDFGVNSWTVS